MRAAERWSVLGSLVLSVWITLALIDGSQRAKYKKTFWGLYHLVSALEWYAKDHGRYPTGDGIEAIARALEPDYMQQVPVKDGWSRPINVELRPYSVTVWSGGADGRRDDEWQDAWEIYQGEGWNSDRDIVVRDGGYLQYKFGTLGGWSGVPNTVWATDRDSDAPTGTLWLNLHRGPISGSGSRPCYPAPTVDLLALDNDTALATIRRPPPVKFVAPEGWYRARLTVKSGQEIYTDPMRLVPDAVTVLDIESRWECVKVLTDRTTAHSRDTVEIRVFQDGEIIDRERKSRAYFQLIPGEYTFVAVSGGERVGCRTVQVKDDDFIRLGEC